MNDSTPSRPNPYVGPRAFRTGEILYGRDPEVYDLDNLLVAERIVLMYSPSGAGKTSLIQAALIPQMEKAGFNVLPVMRVNLDLPPEPEISGRANRYVFSLLLSLEENATTASRQFSLSELAGMTLDSKLVEIIEVPDHPWYIGCQFHPEFKSRPLEPHPLFKSFIKAAVDRKARAGVTRGV